MTRGIQHLSRETCVDAEEVRWLSSDITPVQFGWVSTMDSWTSVNTSRLVGVNFALLSHSDLYGCGVTLINGYVNTSCAVLYMCVMHVAYTLVGPS